MPSTVYILGGISYTAKVHVERRARAILHAGPAPRQLDGTDAAFIADLLTLHPKADEKTRGMRALWVKANMFGEPGFFVERHDGHFVDFSYKKCLTPASVRTQAYAALRRGIAEQVHAFKVRAFSEGFVALRYATCALTGELLTWEDAHVDHAYPQTFTALVAAWFAERGETEADVPVGAHPSGQGVVLCDPDYLAAWRAWHAERAVLRVVRDRLNVERGARP